MPNGGAAKAMADAPGDAADDRYRHRGTRAIQRMVEYAPSTGGLALWVAHADRPGPADPAAPLVATDGRTIFYDAAFEALPLPAQAGLVAHEVLHIALRHAQRFIDLQQRLGDADLQLFNICADAIVNSALGHLAWLQLPAQSVALDTLLAAALDLKQDVTAALLEWDVERLYRAIDDRRRTDKRDEREGRSGRLPRPQPGGGQARQAQAGRGGAASPQQAADGQRGGARSDGPRAARVRALGGRSAADLLPSPAAQVAPEVEAEQAREWSERLLRAHAGDGAHSLLRALLADLPRSRTPWEQVLRTRLARSLAPKRDLSWSRPSRSYLANQGRSAGGRRMPFEPGFSPSRRVPRLVLIVDVSGSIDDELLQRFTREVEAITRRLETGLVLVVGDDRVRRVQRFEPGRADLAGIEFPGGGGTDFTPLLEEAARHDPDIAVVLTDLDGPARVRPLFPVLWAVPECCASAEPPFGRKLNLS